MALLLGFSTSGTSGCVDCPDQRIAERYRFESVMSGWSPGSGRVEVTDSDMTITYSTTDGSKWRVVYTRTGVLERPYSSRRLREATSPPWRRSSDAQHTGDTGRPSIL